MRPQFHFTRVSPGFSLKSTPLGTSPVGDKRTESVSQVTCFQEPRRRMQICPRSPTCPRSDSFGGVTHLVNAFLPLAYKQDYSTVTLFARFLGRSTLQPRNSAI